MFDQVKERESTEYLVVDHTRTPPTKTITVERIDFLDKQSGYFGIRYHFVISRDGTISVGRPLNKQSPITRVACASSVCVVLVGGLSHRANPTNNFTAAQRDALHTLTQMLREDNEALRVVLLDDLINRASRQMIFDVTHYNEVTP